MKYTAKELASIERTMDKLLTAASAMMPSESTDAHNVKAISFIIGELRLAASLMQSEDLLTQQGGVSRALGIFANINNQ
jgi:hypothetical protein